MQFLIHSRAEMPHFAGNTTKIHAGTNPPKFHICQPLRKILKLLIYTTEGLLILFLRFCVYWNVLAICTWESINTLAKTNELSFLMSSHKQNKVLKSQTSLLFGIVAELIRQCISSLLVFIVYFKTTCKTLLVTLCYKILIQLNWFSQQMKALWK